jgi:hypothetical protein
MFEIIPHLYLASYQDAKENATGSNMFVINCSKDLPMIETSGGWTRMYVDDSPNDMYLMTANLPIMVRYIDDQLKSGKDVLVHCFAGQQRSATVIAAYLVDKKGYTIDQAVEYIKSKKPDAFFDGVHFMQSLKEFQY